jgi:hypothetical protein
MATKKPKRKLAVIDFETDPFMYGRVPYPFCVEFYSDERTEIFWGDDCADRLCEFLEKLEEPHIIYAHNGGKFDFHFLHKYIDNPALIIHTRIVECHLFKHTLRDSYAILPVPLRDYEKENFDYARMERQVREKNKADILSYLHSDCVNLYNLVSAFRDKFGDRLTIGGTAIKEIRKIHKFRSQGVRHDETFRNFYFGGRVECFASGIIQGPIKLVDVNSSYPASMRNKRHPINGRFDCVKPLPKGFDVPYFATIDATSRGALPAVIEDGSLCFPHERRIYNACSHEIEIALEYGLLDVHDVKQCLVSTEHITFEEFIDYWAAEKERCDRAGDKSGRLFAKLIMNSGYGRMGINPRNFADWTIHRDIGNEEELETSGYKQQCDYEEFQLWSRQTEIKDESFCDVAIAASITSGSRAILLQGLHNSVDPLYCDTDSIICRDFSGDIDKYRLGAWDLEKTSDMVAIAGKKMYALYSDNLDTVKLSSKGGTLNLGDIINICNGNTVKFFNDAPTFSLTKPPSFISRNFTKTAKIVDKAEIAV